MPKSSATIGDELSEGSTPGRRFSILTHLITPTPGSLADTATNSRSKTIRNSLPVCLQFEAWSCCRVTTTEHTLHSNEQDGSEWILMLSRAFRTGAPVA